MAEVQLSRGVLNAHSWFEIPFAPTMCPESPLLGVSQGQSLDGLSYMLGQEEKKIRTVLAAQVTHRASSGKCNVIDIIL